MKERRNKARDGAALRVLMLMMVDALVVVLSWAVVLCLYKTAGGGQYRYEWYVPYVGWLSIGFVVCNWLLSLYQGHSASPGTPVPRIVEMKRLVLSLIIIHALLAAVSFYQKDCRLSRFVTASSCVLCCLAVQPARNRVRYLMFRYRFGMMPVVIVGSGEAMRGLKTTLSEDAYTGYFVVGEFSLENYHQIPGVRHVICCMPLPQCQIFIRQHFNELTHVVIVPSASVFISSNMSAVDFQGIGGVELVNQIGMGIYRSSKQASEFALSLLATTLSAPILLILGLIVKLTSRGPVLYAAHRLGRDARPIRVYKFRSMYQDADRRLQAVLASDSELRAEWDRDFKLKHDPRVTPFGRFLRKTSLDELPQLFNVLKGDLALIGPRPIVEAEIPRYGKAWDVVSKVKPGVTGLWQVSGRSETSYDTRVRLDLQYILNWSLWMDIWIFFRTIVSVLMMRGAV